MVKENDRSLEGWANIILGEKMTETKKEKKEKKEIMPDENMVKLKEIGNVLRSVGVRHATRGNIVGFLLNSVRDSYMVTDEETEVEAFDKGSFLSDCGAYITSKKQSDKVEIPKDFDI